MLRMVRHFAFVVPLFIIVGCGGVKEKSPPKEAPTLSPEEKKHRLEEIEKMKKMYKKY